MNYTCEYSICTGWIRWRLFIAVQHKSLSVYPLALFLKVRSIQIKSGHIYANISQLWVKCWIILYNRLSSQNYTYCRYSMRRRDISSSNFWATLLNLTHLSKRRDAEKFIRGVDKSRSNPAFNAAKRTRTLFICMTFFYHIESNHYIRGRNSRSIVARLIRVIAITYHVLRSMCCSALWFAARILYPNTMAFCGTIFGTCMR